MKGVYLDWEFNESDVFFGILSDKGATFTFNTGKTSMQSALSFASSEEEGNQLLYIYSSILLEKSFFLFFFVLFFLPKYTENLNKSDDRRPLNVASFIL